MLSFLGPKPALGGGVGVGGGGFGGGFGGGVLLPVDCSDCLLEF